MADIKDTIFTILEKDTKNNQLGWLTHIINYLIVTLVFCNIVAVVIQTEKDIALKLSSQ